MKYRKADPSDIYGIVKVSVDTWKTTYKGIISERILQNRSYEVVTNKWKEKLSTSSDKETIYIAETEDRDIVGFIWASIEKVNPFDGLSDADKFEGELMAIYVLEKYQKRGIGCDLIRLVAKFLIKNNTNSMLVWVLKDNPSKEFYVKLGATYIGDRYLDLDGEKYLESAYGWSDLSAILINNKN